MLWSEVDRDMSWQELTGKRVVVGDEIAEVVHVDSFRVVLETEGGEGVAPHRLVVSPDDPIELRLAGDDDRGERRSGERGAD